MIGRDLLIRKHHLPHWQLGGSTYFVTFRTADRTLSAAERGIVAEALRYEHGRRCDLAIAVVMPDHVHVLLTPLARGDGEWFDLGVILKSVKGVSARRINQSRDESGSLWQPERFDRIVRDEAEFEEKWAYIRSNPVRAGLVEFADEYDGLILPEAVWRES